MKKNYALGLLAILSLTGGAQSLCANDSTESSEDTSTQETLTQERVLIESPFDYDLIPEDSVSHDTDDYCVPEDTAGESTTYGIPENTMPENTIDGISEDTTEDVVLTPASDEDTVAENTVDLIPEATVAENTVDDGINPEATVAENTVDEVAENTVAEDTTDAVIEDTQDIVNAEAVAENTIGEVIITPASGEDTTPENTIFEMGDEITRDAVSETTIDESTIDAVDESTTDENTIDAVAEDTVNDVVITPASDEDTVAEDTAEGVPEATVPEDTVDAVDEQTTVEDTGVTVNNITSNDTIDPDEVSGTIAVTGTTFGVDTQVGDAVNMTINGTDYTTTVGSGGTWSVDVSSNDLVQDREFVVNVISTYSTYSIKSSAISTHKVSLLTALQAHYEFEGNLNDSSGNDRNLSIVDGGTANYMAGKIGNAYYFNGTNNSLRTSALTSSTDGTFSFWINTNLTTLQNIIKSKSVLGTNDGAGVFVNADGTMNVSTTNTTTANTSAPVGIQDGNWHHVVLTFGSVLTPMLYVDGVSIVFDTFSVGALGLQSILDIGNNEGYHLTGYMDDVRIYSRALTASDVAELCYINILHANFTFNGNTTLLNNSYIDGYLTKQDVTTFEFLRNLPNSVSTTSSTPGYDYNSSFPDLDENQTLTIRLSVPMDGNVFGMTVLHTELNATNNLNLTKSFTLSSLSIPVGDIGNVREIVFSTSDGNFSGNIIFENNYTHINNTYQIPIMNGTYTIAASYRDGNISYYDSSTNSWGGNSPSVVTISADTTLVSLPVNMTTINYNDKTSCEAYGSAWVISVGTGVCMNITQTLAFPTAALSRSAITSGESNVFRFTLASAQNIAIFTRNISGNVGQNTDTYGALYDSTGTLIAESENASSRDYNFKILTNLQAGDYTLVVRGYNGNAVPEYQLNILNNYNPKIAKHLNYGYSYVSLPSSKTLCDEDVQGAMDSCDQDNTLESVFGNNSVFKFGREWMYWNSDVNASPAYSMQKFSTINPLEGILVKTSDVNGTTIYLPYDENSEVVNDYTNLFPAGWTLMSNNKAQAIGAISTALAAEGKELVYILVLRDNAWHVYPSSAAVSPSIPMSSGSIVNKYESYWVYFK